MSWAKASGRGIVFFLLTCPLLLGAHLDVAFHQQVAPLELVHHEGRPGVMKRVNPDNPPPPPADVLFKSSSLSLSNESSSGAVGVRYGTLQSRGD